MSSHEHSTEHSGNQSGNQSGDHGSCGPDCGCATRGGAGHAHGEAGHAHDSGCGCGDGGGRGRGPLADASVRRARPSDAPAVGLVQVQAMRTDYSTLLPPAAMTALAQVPEGQVATTWRQALQTPPTPRHRLLVACAGDQVVGLAAFGPSEDGDTDDETADLATLAVHPQARGQGHGSRLLNAVVDEARAAGFTWLTTWVPLNAAAMRAFLQGAGMGPDRARRERIVDADGTALMEVRLGAAVSIQDDSE